MLAELRTRQQSRYESLEDIDFEGISSSNSMGQLCGQRGGDGMEVELFAAIVDWHLPPLAVTKPIPIALHCCNAKWTACNM